MYQLDCSKLELDDHDRHFLDSESHSDLSDLSAPAMTDFRPVGEAEWRKLWVKNFGGDCTLDTLLIKADPASWDFTMGAHSMDVSLLLGLRKSEGASGDTNREFRDSLAKFNKNVRLNPPTDVLCLIFSWCDSRTLSFMSCCSWEWLKTVVMAKSCGGLATMIHPL